MASLPAEAVACPDCDLLQRIPQLEPGAKARCARCGHVLASQSADPLDRPLALTLAAAVAFIVANTASLMDLSAVGRFASTTIPNGAWEMWLQGEKITALIVAFCAVVAPGAYILFMLVLLLAIRRPPAPHWVGELLRWGNSMLPWSMGEVMILGIMGECRDRDVRDRRAGRPPRRDLDDLRSSRGLEARRVGGWPRAVWGGGREMTRIGPGR
jgi:paraquat-inducible protein A